MSEKIYKRFHYKEVWFDISFFQDLLWIQSIWECSKFMETIRQIFLENWIICGWNCQFGFDYWCGNYQKWQEWFDENYGQYALLGKTFNHNLHNLGFILSVLIF